MYFDSITKSEYFIEILKKNFEGTKSSFEVN